MGAGIMQLMTGTSARKGHLVPGLREIRDAAQCPGGWETRGASAERGDPWSPAVSQSSPPPYPDRAESWVTLQSHLKAPGGLTKTCLLSPQQTAVPERGPRKRMVPSFCGSKFSGKMVSESEGKANCYR